MSQSSSAITVRLATPGDGAACAAVYLHGLAGDIVKDEIGDTGMAAGDLAEKIPLAIQRLRGMAG